MLTSTATLEMRKRTLADIVADLNTVPLLRKVAQCISTSLHGDCELCEKPWCFYHRQHVDACPCPPEKAWRAAGLNSPTEENRIDATLRFLARHDAVASTSVADEHAP